jgi:DNA-methyltransferase (dcm)
VADEGQELTQSNGKGFALSVWPDALFLHFQSPLSVPAAFYIYWFRHVCSVVCVASGTESVPEKVYETNQSNQYAAGSMFAGIGGICLGFKNAGAKMVWANEIDSDACSTYRKNMGSEYLVQGDIKTIKAEDIPTIDILTAGFPCQAFSIAGYRKGFEDERGVLFFEIMRVIESKRPRAVFIENVKNLVKHDNGQTFANIKQCLKDSGYKVDSRVFNTKDYGNIPQNRERVYIVAFRDEEDLKNFSFPEPVALTEKISSVINKKSRKDDAYYYKEGSLYYSRLNEGMTNLNTVYQWRRVYIRENKNNLCPTLTANMGTGGHNVPLIRDDFGIRKLTPEECLKFQGFPSEFVFPNISKSSKYKQAGNSVSVPVVQKIAQNIITAMEHTDKGTR